MATTAEHPDIATERMDGDGICPADVRRGIWARFTAFLRDVVATLRDAGVPRLAAQVAYSLIFAMPSILLIVTLVAVQVDQWTDYAITGAVRRAILMTLPAEVQPVMTGLLDDAMVRASVAPTTLSAIVSLFVALIMAGSGLSALSDACCSAAGIEDRRSAWVKRVLFTGGAVLLAVIVIGGFALMAWGGDLIRVLGGRIVVPQMWSAVWERLQLPALALLVFGGIAWLYMMGTGQYLFWRVAPGALVATALWLLAVKGFQLYLQVAQPGTAYGAASGALVFLIFLYVSAIVFIIGGMIAAVMARRGNRV